MKFALMFVAVSGVLGVMTGCAESGASYRAAFANDERTEAALRDDARVGGGHAETTERSRTEAAFSETARRSSPGFASAARR